MPNLKIYLYGEQEDREIVNSFLPRGFTPIDSITDLLECLRKDQTDQVSVILRAPLLPSSSLFSTLESIRTKPDVIRIVQTHEAQEVNDKGEVSQSVLRDSHSHVRLDMVCGYSFVLNILLESGLTKVQDKIKENKIEVDLLSGHFVYVVSQEMFHRLDYSMSVWREVESLVSLLENMLDGCLTLEKRASLLAEEACKRRRAQNVYGNSVIERDSAREGSEGGSDKVEGEEGRETGRIVSSYFRRRDKELRIENRQANPITNLGHDELQDYIAYQLQKQRH